MQADFLITINLSEGTMYSFGDSLRREKEITEDLGNELKNYSLITQLLELLIIFFFILLGEIFFHHCFIRSVFANAVKIGIDRYIFIKIITSLQSLL